MEFFLKDFSRKAMFSIEIIENDLQQTSPVPSPIKNAINTLVCQRNYVTSFPAIYDNLLLFIFLSDRLFEMIFTLKSIYRADSRTPYCLVLLKKTSHA